MEQGLVHIYTGDGKGKTTAAAGLAVRAAGRGLRVGFFQFLKNGVSGEVVALARLGVQTFSPQTGKFLWDMDEAEKAACARKQRETLQRAVDMAGDFDLVVLDEVIGAAGAGMVDEAELERFVAGRPRGLELVLTGRNAGEALCALADYVTEMRCLAHPFEKGIPARKGIEL